MDSRKNTIEHAAAGTCGWLLNHPVWLRWQQQHQSRLWILGKPGSGKSTLLNYAIREMERQDMPESLIISFFVHGRGNELQKNPLGLYRSIIHQLLQKVPKAFYKLIKSFAQHLEQAETGKNTWIWSMPLLQGYLQDALPLITKRYRVSIFIDALDEAGKDAARKIVDFFKPYTDTLREEGKPLHILFSCRYHPHLYQGDGLDIRLDQENRGDIMTLCRTSMSPSLYEDIGEILTTRSEGVFIWAHLVIPEVVNLDSDGESAITILHAVEKMPEKLEDLYHNIVQRDLGPGTDPQLRMEALGLFQWICYSGWPLSLEDLQWALAMGTCDESLNSLSLIERSPGFITLDRLGRRINSLSCGLVELISIDTGRDSTSVSDSTTVSDAMSVCKERAQFIHQTVEDYFINKGLSDLERSIESQKQIAQTDTRAHLHLSNACLRFMRLYALSWGKEPKQRQQTADPFWEYVAFRWRWHFKEAEQIEAHRKVVFELFMSAPEQFFHAWSSDHAWRHVLVQVTNVVQFSCLKGLVSLLDHALEYCQDHAQMIDMPQLDGMTPLILAAFGGSPAVVKRLLQTRKVNINLRDANGRTPLSWAAIKGYETIAQMLLQAGAKVEAQNKEGRTPLFWAAGYGHVACVKVLLKAGAKIEAQDEIGQTPLSYAAQSGCEACVQLLLQAGAEMEARDDMGARPLSYAAESGHEGVVWIFPQANEVIHVADMLGRTALSEAVVHRHEACVRLLLQHGANVEVQDTIGRTPLCFAAYLGDGACVQLLLQYGANMEAKAEEGGTPLIIAADRGHVAVVRLLLQHGANVEVQDKATIGRTPLFFAAHWGDGACVQLLLQYGANMEAEDEEGGTPLTIAADRGHVAVVRLLLEKGAVNTLSIQTEAKLQSVMEQQPMCLSCRQRSSTANS